MKKMWKTFFSKEKENNSNFISDDKNSLINKKQQLDLISNQDSSNNIKMLNDLSLSEKTYLERELSFKYDCDKFKLLKVSRIDSQFFDVECEIFLNDKKLIITERIYYHNIKNKVEDF